MKITLPAWGRLSVRTVCVLIAVAGGITGCATQSPPVTESTSALPELKPGEARMRMNGQLGWYGGFSSARK